MPAVSDIIFAATQPAVEAAAVAGRLEAVEAIEGLRRAVLTENPLGVKNQHLVHFGQLVVLGHATAAGSCALAARRAGATPAELVGVVETTLFAAGMPAYELGLTVLADVLADGVRR